MVFESFKDIQIIQVHCLESQFINCVVFLLWIMKLKRNNCYCFVFSISWITTKTTYFFSANFWHIIPTYLSKQIKKKRQIQPSQTNQNLCWLGIPGSFILFSNLYWSKLLSEPMSREAKFETPTTWTQREAQKNGQ